MRYFLVLVFGLLFFSLSFSQEEERPVFYDDSIIEKQTITKDDLKSYKADKDFDYTETKKEDNFKDS